MRTRSGWLAVASLLLVFSPVYAENFVFIHHSVGSGLLSGGMYDAVLAKTYVDNVHDITYDTDMDPDAGRPDSLADVPGDLTDMNHWILWFNDYLNGVRSHQCATGFNQIIMFKSCFPNSDVSADGTEPGDPFSWDRTVANYRAVFRHPSGAGNTYTYEGATYRALADVFAAHPDILFIPVTAPPLTFDGTTDANAHRARVFNNWLKNDWLSAYNAAHPGLRNVAVFDLFDVLAYPDNYALHPNRLREEYGGASGDAHPNEAGNTAAVEVFATDVPNFIDLAWAAFNGQACSYSISPTSREHGTSAEEGTIQVTAGAGCAWTAQPNAFWISIVSGATGAGNGTVTYHVEANESGQERTGTITVAGRTFTVTQISGPGNSPPVADAGPDQQVFASDQVSLHATGTDPDGDNLAFRWTQKAGPEAPLTGSDTADASFVAPSVSAVTQLVFQVRVEDGRGGYDTDSCAVTVYPVSPNTLVFPAFFHGVDATFASSFVGVAVSSLNTCDNSICVRGLDEQGGQVGETKLAPPLTAGGQIPFLTSEALNPESGALTALIGGNHAPVRGFFMVGEDPPARLDGIGTELKISRNLYFILAKRGLAIDTTIYAHNPTASEASTTFKWINQEGVSVAETTLSVPSGGTVMRTLAQLFPDGPVTLDGYVRLTSSQKLVGCLVHTAPDSFVTLSGEPGAAAARLLAPHFYIPAEGGGTELRFVNVGPTKATLKIRAFQDGHQAFGEATREIAPSAMLVCDLATLLQAPVVQLDGAGAAYTGYLDVELTAQPLGGMPRPAYVLGAMTFWGNGGQFAAALPLMAEGYVQTLFPHLAQSIEFNLFTGLSVLNAGTEPANGTVTAFDTQGAQTGQSQFSLDPGCRVIDVLNGSAFFGGTFSQNGGYLVITSDHPVVSFALFGDLNLAYMAAIGGQNLAEN
jgi:hypothetical protein